MNKKHLAYKFFQNVTDCRITTRSRTIKEDGQSKRFTETLLLIPVAVAPSLNLSSVSPQPFADKKTKDEFVAVVLSATKPRMAKKTPEMIAAQEAEQKAWQEKQHAEFLANLFTGQCVDHQEHGIGVVLEYDAAQELIAGDMVDRELKCEMTPQGKERLEKTLVRIWRAPYMPKTLFTSGQVVTQLEFFNENNRLLNVIRAEKAAGKDVGRYRLLEGRIFKNEDPTLRVVPALTILPDYQKQFDILVSQLREDYMTGYGGVA